MKRSVCRSQKPDARCGVGLVFILLAGIVLAQGIMGAWPAAYARGNVWEETPSVPAIKIPTSGRFRAVVVFVRFRDDAAVWEGCTPASQAWAEPDVLPAFAPDLLASTPVPPFPEYSLTAYFYQQSQGRFTLFGDVYPHVVITEKNEADYRKGQSANLDLGTLTKEILDRINADARFDLGAYDADNDGYIDHVFFVLRKLAQLRLSGGASGCAFVGYSSPAPEFGNDPRSLKMVHAGFSGTYVRYNNAGNIIPEVDLVRLMAHEFGHDLWSHSPLRGVHVQALGGAYGVPANGTDQVGYVLMAGTGGGRDRRGDETISAFERDVLKDGWITCPVLTDEGSYRLTDLYSDTTANCYKLEIPVPSPVPLPRTVYLTNRQRVGFFDRLRTNTCTNPPNDHGLKTTGLLVTVARLSHLAVVPADNTLDLNNESRAYAGDLYGPGTAVQLTPWTRPTLAGYTTYPDEWVPQEGTFQAVDNIRYTGEPHGVMAFDYVEDFRKQPVIRENSWIGPETAGYDFEGDVVVTNRRTLTINTTLQFSGTLRIEARSTVVVDTEGKVLLNIGSTLDLGDDARVIVRGQLIPRGTIHKGRGAAIVYEDRPGLPTGIAPEESSPAFVVEAPYPNPFNAQTIIAYDLPQAAFVTLRVYDALGRLVATLVDGRQGAGSYRVVFEGSRLPRGVYFSRFEAGGFHQVHQMVLVR